MDLGKDLYEAAERGDIEQATAALDAGADVNWRKVDYASWAPLHAASRNGHEAAVRLLIERSADVNAASSRNTPPLHPAVENGHAPIVHLLLENEANVNAADLNNFNALHYAAYFKHTAIAELLLLRGADATLVSVRHILSTNCKCLRDADPVYRRSRGAEEHQSRSPETLKSLG